MDGKRFERDVEGAFMSQGITARRPRQDRPVDVGDIWVEDDIVIQAKAWRNLPQAIREGVAGSQAQKRHAHRPIGVAVAKQPGANVLDSLVVMPLRDFVELIKSREFPEQ